MLQNNIVKKGLTFVKRILLAFVLIMLLQSTFQTFTLSEATNPHSFVASGGLQIIGLRLYHGFRRMEPCIIMEFLVKNTGNRPITGISVRADMHRIHHTSDYRYYGYDDYMLYWKPNGTNWVDGFTFADELSRHDARDAFIPGIWNIHINLCEQNPEFNETCLIWETYINPSSFR